MENIKINKFEIENVKRVKAVSYTPTENGLTIIGGENKQGKTSVLDAITWALGGNKHRPKAAKREGSLTDPEIKITLSNGLIVERKGKNSDLKVTDPKGEKAGQALLNSFIEELALDLPKFMEMSDKDKAKKLLEIIGIGEELEALTDKENRLYNQRTEIGRIQLKKEKSAEDMPFYTDTPENTISISELIQEQQDILAKNGENKRLRSKKAEIEYELKAKENKFSDVKEKIEELENELENLTQDILDIRDDLEAANETVENLEDISTEEIENSINNIEKINEKVRINKLKLSAESEAEELKKEYDGITEEINDTRKAQIDLLNGVEMPLEDLSVKDGCLIYEGFEWSDMSGAQQLKVATSIVRKLNPQCGFVLMDKLEGMDLNTIKEFNDWLVSEDLQVIGTKVSTGDECSIIISDGFVEGKELEVPSMKNEQKKTWEVGKF